VRATFRRLGYLFGRDRRADELAEEMELHRILAEQEGLEAGLTPDEAAHHARLRMGNETLAREDARALWSFWFLDELLQDLRYGIRMSTRNGRSTLLAIVALGIGIGLNAAVFTAYKAMVARPLDARAPHEMVNIALTRDTGAAVHQFGYPDYVTYRDSLRSLSGLIASRNSRVTLSNAGSRISQRTSFAESGLGRLGIIRPGIMNAEFARVHVVSENYFEVLGVKALHGRTFESIGAAALLAQPSVLISENYWQRRFDGSDDILGKTVHLNGVAVRIVGITPRDFVGADMGTPAFWTPISIEPLLNADDQWLNDTENQRYSLRGRLAPGVAIAQAQAEISAVSDRLRALHDPESDWARPATALVWPGSPFPLPFWMYRLDWIVLALTAAALLVLAVGCANVASLQLARARSRQGELRTRLSLGASRQRVVRQLVTESALVGILAGGLALLCTWALLKELAFQYSAAFPVENGSFVFDVTPGLGIVAAVFAVALLAGIFSGLAPALESTRTALAGSVRAGASSLRTRRLQNTLVGAQVCLSVVLLIGAGALLHSSVRAVKAPTGYDLEQTLLLDFQFPEWVKYREKRKLAVVHQLRARLAAQPGVAAISSARAPDARRFWTAAVTIEQDARPSQPGDSEQNVQSILGFTYVEANFFETLGMPLRLGSGFPSQGSAAQSSVVVSESAAKKLWPDQNPIGRTVRLGSTEERFRRLDELDASGQSYEVVGVVGDKRPLTFERVGAEEIYLALPPEKLAGRPILIRAHADTGTVREALEPLIRSVDANLQASALTLEEMLQSAPLFAVSSMAAAVASMVGGCGLLLALMGIYGTVGYIVALRTREVGIRMAIGAQKRDVVRLILRESFRPVLAGLLLGASLAAGGSYLVHRLVFGVNGFDSMSVVGVALLFLAVTFCAAYPPARRATRIDPMIALRHE
jgi:predicted permease